MTPTTIESMLRHIAALYPRADEITPEIADLIRRKCAALDLGIDQAKVVCDEMRVLKRYFTVTDLLAMLRTAAYGTERVKLTNETDRLLEQQREDDAKADECDARTLRWWNTITVEQRRELLAAFNASKYGRWMQLAGLNIDADGTPFNRGLLHTFAGAGG